MRHLRGVSNLLGVILASLCVSGCPWWIEEVTVSVSPENVQIAIGETANFSAASTDAEDDFTWYSSNNAVATVNSIGQVNGVGPGIVTITATGTHSGESDYAQVEVLSAGEGEGEGEGETPFIKVPDPLSGDNPTYKLIAAAVPTAGQSVADSRLGTSQRRVTQTLGVRHEYSRFDPFNVDQTRIILTDIQSGDFLVYRTASVPYDQAANLELTLGIAEARWDPVDPLLIWGFRDFSVITVNAETGQETVIKDFAQDATIGPIISANPDLWRITDKDEGESSVNKRYWVLMLQGVQDDYRARYLFTWDRQMNAILGTYTVPLNESNIDWVGMSPDGTWVLIGGDSENSGNLAGLTMADKTFTQFHRINYDTAHADVGYDSDGNEVIVMQNNRNDYIDLLPIDLNTEPMLDAAAGYAGTNRVPLIRLYYDSESPDGLNSGVHVSCNFPGYCVVSANIPSGAAEQNWLDRSIVLVKLDRENPQVFYLSKVYGTTDAYWEETQAAISNDGMRLIWATNWNQQVGQERVWIMQLNMPNGWSNSF